MHPLHPGYAYNQWYLCGEPKGDQPLNCWAAADIQSNNLILPNNVARKVLIWTGLDHLHC